MENRITKILKKSVDYKAGSILMAAVLVVMIFPYAAWNFLGVFYYVLNKSLAVLLPDYLSQSQFLSSHKGSSITTLHIAFFVLGAFAAAKISGEFRIKHVDRKQAVQSAIGGLLMGIGVTYSLICNIGVFLNTLPMLSIGAYLFAVGVISGAITGAWYIKKQEDL